MAEVILVLLHRPETAAGMLDGAECLTDLLGGARITALAIREPVHLSPLAAGSVTYEADLLLAAKAGEQERIAALQQAFERWVAGRPAADGTARWVAAEGNAATIIEARGSRADIVLVARPQEEDGAAMRHAVRAALFATERPVLLLPPGPPARFGRHVAIAWKDDQRMLKALLPALRLLGRAERIEVLIGVRQGAAPALMPLVLREHDIRADLTVLPIGSGSFGEALLAKVHQLGADMLVMGAYAHSAVREAILGGVTRYMLSRADLPVLMRH
jgi:nucleotide-binding universal stress UspA family protein